MSAKNGVEMVKKVAEFISKGTSFDRVTQMVSDSRKICVRKRGKTTHCTNQLKLCFDKLCKQDYR